MDAASRVRTDLLMLPSDSPHLVVTGPQGEVGVMLGMGNEGNASLMLKDASSE